MLLRRIIFFSCLLGACALKASAVEISTATGNLISYDNKTGVAIIDGNAVVQNATATLKADNIQLNTTSRMGRATGHVVLEQSSATITGTEAEYNWYTSTGIIKDAVGTGDPWGFDAHTLEQVSPDVYLLSNGDVTSCNENPPHYRIHSSRAKVTRGKRMTLYYPWLIAEDTPFFWFPFYTRSLVPKKYRLRIEPGQTSRDGFTNKTIFGYPYTENSWTDLRWDYLQRTGNGFGVNHRYFAPSAKGDFDWYYIRDINPDPQPQSRRYSVLWNHYQKLATNLSLNSKIDFKSDQTLGNEFQDVGNRVYVENQTRGLLSEAGLNYQLPRVSLQAQFDRRDKFDSTVASKNFVSHVTLPALTFNTIPLTSKRFPFYTSFSGGFVNDTVERTDPKQSLRYQRRANLGTNLKKDIRLAKKWTFTPQAGFNETWQNRTVTATTTVSEADFYQGRYNAGLDVRRRIKRILDITLGYRYGERLAINQLKPDSDADDYGVETNQFNLSFVSQIQRDTRISLGSGYDVRNAPRNFPTKYEHDSERVLPISFDMQWEAKKNVNVFFREIYSVFDPTTRTVIHRPVNTSGELQLGQLTNSTFFSQGFSYSQPASGAPSELFLTNKLKFYLTRKWYVDLFISYRAVAEQKMQYSKLFPIQKSLQVVRDMHCWLLRLQWDQKPDRTEVSAYIDLKANMTKQKNIFNEYNGSVYGTRTDDIDMGQVFPEPAADSHPVAPAQP